MTTAANQVNRLHSLDVLRGLAVLSVVAFHCATTGPSGHQVVDTLFGYGKLGVQLFFLISAITMCHMWEQRSGESSPKAKFYIRRFMRIAPLFWLAMALYLGVNGMAPSERTGEGITPIDITLTALLLHGFWPPAINTVVPGGWSIAVEITFYALFPFLILAFGNRRWLYLASAAALITGYQFALHNWLEYNLTAHGFTENTTGKFLYFNFLNHAPMFLIGCYMYFALNERANSLECDDKKWEPVFVNKSHDNKELERAFDSIKCHHALELATTFPSRKSHRTLELIAIGAFSIFAWTFDQPFPLICIWLSATTWLILCLGPKAQLLERFGQNSYAIYLTHFIVLQALPALTGGVLQLLIRFTLIAGICYFLAQLIHNGIERPLSQITKRMVNSLDVVQAGSKRLASP